jgi:hypothetical protein
MDEELVTPESVKDMPRDTMAWVEEMDGRGVRVQGNRLAKLPTATTVRVREGDVVLADGPFAETKEQLGGFWIIDVPDLDAALEWAGKATVACGGPVEVRPFQQV